MMFLSILAFTLLMFACYGCGDALIRWSGIRDMDNFPFLSTVGIACLIFLGGVLTLVRLAYPAALTILFLIGLAFFLVKFVETAKSWLVRWRAVGLIGPEKFKSRLEYALPVGILAAAVGFYALTLLPVSAFNLADDFYTYLPRPFRMLQTGTLIGNPYEVLGTDSLGGHAFLQGFVLLGLPVEYLQGLEAVFAFALAGMLLIAIGRKFNLHWSYVSLALIGFIIINPQSVNVSPIYLGSAFILGIILASCYLLEQMEKSEDGSIPKVTVGILGLLLAALLGIKNTFLPYGLTYFAFFFVGLSLISAEKWKVLRAGGLVMLFALAAILPWLALYLPNLLSAVHIASHPSSVTSTENTFTSFQGHISSLFSDGKLPYGSSVLSYGVVVLMLALIGLYVFFIILKDKVTPLKRGYLLVAMACCLAGITSYFFFGLIIAPVVVIRYSCPVLIAALPFAWLAASMAVADSQKPAKLLSWSGTRVAIIMLMALLVVVIYWDNFITRVERAYYLHITLSANADYDKYIEVNRYLLSKNTKQKIRDIQNKTQPGEKIFAWVPAPMHLDFSRNEIYSITYASLLNPWLDMPLNGNVYDMVRFLKGQGIRYIMWSENDGILEAVNRKELSSPYAVYRRIAKRGFYLRDMLASIIQGGEFLYNANGIVLFDLKQIKI